MKHNKSKAYEVHWEYEKHTKMEVYDVYSENKNALCTSHIPKQLHLQILKGSCRNKKEFQETSSNMKYYGIGGVLSCELVF